MQTANARLRLNKVGSDVPITGLTPAEALVLHILHQGNNGGSTFGEEFEKITDKKECVVVLEPAVPAVGEVGKPGYVPAKAAVTRPRTDVEELRRLTAKYGANVNKKGDKIIKLIWPGMDVKLPQTFDQLDWKNLQYDGVEVAPVNYATGAPLATK